MTLLALCLGLTFGVLALISARRGDSFDAKLGLTANVAILLTAIIGGVL